MLCVGLEMNKASHTTADLPTVVCLYRAMSVAEYICSYLYQPPYTEDISMKAKRESD
jgi:hypothetical protein